MRRLLLLSLACLALFLALILAPSPARAGGIVVIPIKGEIGEAKFLFLRRGLKSAELGRADAVILDMDTYGGELEGATQMQQALLSTSVPTYTYIDANAGSAGALIAIATRHIYMAPTAAIGAAAPVTSSGADLPSTMQEKTDSYFSGKARGAAMLNGYNPDIAQAFISKEIEVKIGNTVVHPKGTLLTLSAQEAARQIDGKPVLASGIATSLGDLMAKAGLHGEIREFSPSGFETLAFWLTSLAPLLLLGGIAGVYIEIKVGGFGLAGAVAAVCFLLFFFGSYIAGLAGWEVVVVFCLGLSLVISEIMVHPGTILPGLLGLALVAGSLLWAMTDRYPHQPYLPTAPMLERPLLNLCITIVLCAICFPILAKFLPRTPLFRAFALGRENPRGPSFSPATVSSPASIPVGASGVALSMLRPSGNARFGDRVVDVITRGDFIEPASSIRVLAVEGSRIVVART